jgi:hypothetical protein
MQRGINDFNVLFDSYVLTSPASAPKVMWAWMEMVMTYLMACYNSPEETEETHENRDSNHVLSKYKSAFPQTYSIFSLRLT